uniref:Uncharacterized protein n=1 Tax=Tetranychus urticae TaxID=32264 RepID=T1JWY1_TETUR
MPPLKQSQPQQQHRQQMQVRPLFDTPPVEDDDNDNDPYKFRMEEDAQKETETTINSLSKKRKRAFKIKQKMKALKKSNNLNVDGDDGGKNDNNDGNTNSEENIKKGTAHLESIRAELDTVDEIFTDNEDDDQFNGLIDDYADREIHCLLDKNTFDVSIFKDNREPGTTYTRIKPKRQHFNPIKIKTRPLGKKTVKNLKLVFDSNLEQYEWQKDLPINYPFSVDLKKIYILNDVSEDPKTQFWINSMTELFRNKIHYADFKHYTTNTSDDLTEFRLALGYVPLQYKPFCMEMYRMKEKTAKGTKNSQAYKPYFYLGELEMLAYCYWELSTQDVLNMDLTPTKKKAIKILLQQAAKDFKNMPVASENKDEFDSFYFDFKNSCLFNNPELTYIDMLAIKERFAKIYRFINESELSSDDKEDAIWIWFNIFQQANCHHYMVPYTKMRCWAMLNQFVTHLKYFSQIPSNKFSLDGLKELSKTFIESVYGDKFTDKNARSTVGSRIFFAVLKTNSILFYHYILMYVANGVSSFKTLNYKLTPELAKAFHFCLMEALKFLNNEILDKNEFADGLKSIPFIGDIENDFSDPAVFSETFRNSLFNYNLSNDPDNNDEDDDEYEPRCKIFKRYNDPDFWRGKEKPNDKNDNKCMLCYKGRSPRAFKFYQNCDDSTNNNFVLMTVCSFCINCMKNNSSEQMQKLNSEIYDRVKSKNYKAPLLYSITNKTKNEYTIITEPVKRTVTKATRSYELDIEALKKNTDTLNLVNR